MGLARSYTDPCLYYKWVEGGSVMMMSWIDDNAVGKEHDMLDLKELLKQQLVCDDCGPMNEYTGCTIETCKLGGTKFLQNVLLQSYNDEFDIKNL